MELLVRNAEGNVPATERDYAAKKLGRLDRYFHQANKVEMVHREEGNNGVSSHRIEITVFADGFTIRGEERDHSLHAAIDKVCEKLETRLSRLKGRLVHNHRRKGNSIPQALLEDHSEEEHHNGHVEVRERKVFLLKPMSIEEAALQMEMVDHPFFVYRDEDSNQVSVLYRRKDKAYGLLEPEM